MGFSSRPNTQKATCSDELSSLCCEMGKFVLQKSNLMGNLCTCRDSEVKWWWLLYFGIGIFNKGFGNNAEK